MNFGMTYDFNEIITHQSWNSSVNREHYTISFSYRTCLPNIDLISLNFYTINNHHFQLKLSTSHFRLRTQLIHNAKMIHDFIFHNSITTTQNSTTLSYDQFQVDTNYYHQIVSWQYVRVTLSRNNSFSVSLNEYDNKPVPLLHFSPSFFDQIVTTLSVIEYNDDEQTNLTCFKPHQGFIYNSNKRKKSTSISSQCTIDINKCEHRVCTDDEQYCQLFKIFECQPFTDSHCSFRTTPIRCLHNHCSNNGTCYVDIIRNITTCVCPLGWAGDKCNYNIDECQSNTCPKNTHCIDLINNYTCVCDSGWTGNDCLTDIDECETLKPCKAAKTCLNLPGTYKCDCYESFGGKNCEMTLDPCFSLPCMNNAECYYFFDKDTVNYRCHCATGFTGNNCESNINDCEGIICPQNNTICVDKINSFDCTCKNGSKRNWDGSCTEIKPCDSSPCLNNATCYQNTNGGYQCICPSNYQGVTCAEDVDECKIFSSICRNNATCLNEIGSYRCYCSSGWSGPTCATDINFCLSNPCNNNGTCISKINGYECQCNSKYTGNYCENDIDECLTYSICQHAGTCHNYYGGFHCSCMHGYFGQYCEQTPSDCPLTSLLSPKCLNAATCIVNDTEKLRYLNNINQTCLSDESRLLNKYFQCLSIGDSSCECPSNISCSDAITACSKNPCRNGGQCFSRTNTSYRCYCPLGLTGLDCTQDHNECSSGPCYNGATCINQVNKFSCQCRDGYTGNYCQTFIDPCKNNPCLHGGLCVREKEKFICDCSKTKYVGGRCETYQSPCSTNRCHHNSLCIEINDNYECLCSFGYAGTNCNETIDMCKSNFCLNGGQCQTFTRVLNNSSNNTGVEIEFTCNCLPGFTGVFCETNIDECFYLPCLHGICTDLINGYHCSCFIGYSGFNCELDDVSPTGKHIILYDECKNYCMQSGFCTSLTSSSNSAQVECDCEMQCDHVDTFHLKNNYINITEIIPIKIEPKSPIKIVYDYLTTLPNTVLFSIGSSDYYLIQSIVDKKYLSTKIISNESKIISETVVEIQSRDENTWQRIIIDLYNEWVDIEIEKEQNPSLKLKELHLFSMPQRLHLNKSLELNLLFGYSYNISLANYSGCVRNMFVKISQSEKIPINDQLVLTNENRTLGCKKSDACQQSTCTKNELCENHWFYHECRCQRPYDGYHCDQVSPILQFNSTSSVNVSFANNYEPISNISLFLNILQPSAVVFSLTGLSNKKPTFKRFRRANENDKISSYDTTVIGSVLNGRFKVMLVDKNLNHYEAKSSKMINDGRSHKIDVEFKPTLSLVVDDEENVPLVLISNNRNKNGEDIESIKPETIQFGKGSLDRTPEPMLGWLQDFRLNNHQIPLLNNNTDDGIKVVVDKVKLLDKNPCYPINPCKRNGICMPQYPNSYICQCSENITGRNCTEPKFCNGTQGNICPNGFTCKIINENQECVATGTFDDNSSLTATLVFNYHDDTETIAKNYSLYHYQIFDRLEFQLQTRSQRSHLFTLKNERADSYMSFYIHNTELIYKDSNIKIQLIKLNRSNTFRCQWSNNGSFQFLTKLGDTFQLHRTILTNLSLNDIVVNGTKLNVGYDNEEYQFFRGCIDYILVGDVYVPFYSQSSLQNDTRTTRFVVDTIENIQINNCIFDNVCESNNCVNGTCQTDFDTYRCQCDRGFKGSDCSINIDECLINNCTTNGICIDQIGNYTCKCYEGFTGVFCETNIDDCIFGPCLHDGQCIDLINGYTCNCTQDYIGFNCSISKNKTCLGRPCENNGHCLAYGVYSSYPTTRCQCQAGFSGTYCEEDLCSMLSCQNNGTCIRTDNNASCLCSKQWHGQSCILDVNECELYGEQLCLHNGSCHNYPGTYECRCQENYLGENCERLHDCLVHNPCQNSGSCKPLNENFFCLCSTNYTGSTCELLTCNAMPCKHNGTCVSDIDKGFSCNCTDTGYEDSICGTEIDECLSNPCYNNGTCTHSIGKYECKCQHPYTGKQCNIKSEFLFRFSYHLVVWPGVALLLLLIIILLTVTIRRIRENRRSRGTYRPAIHENNSSRVEFSMILKPPQEERLI